MDQNKSIIKKPSSNISSNDSQLRQSNGFSQSGSINTQKMRISGQGFRPSSRDRNSGSSTNLGESKFFNEDNLYSLNLFPMGQDEFAFASTIKADLLQVQEELNELDPDNKLRSSGNIEFGKGYQTTLKKWLGQFSDSNIKQSFDKRVKADLDVNKITEALGQKGNTEEALKKLYKLCLIFEIVANKLTEFEMVSLMRYDDTYSNLVKDEPQANQLSKLKMIAGQGQYQFSKFSICFANMERFASLIRASKKIASKQTGTFMTDNQNDKLTILESSIKELKETIRKRDFRIKELNEKIVDLETKIEQQQKELIQATQQAQSDKSVQKIIGKTPDSFKENPSYWTGLIDETKVFYEQRIREHELENISLKEKLEDTKIKMENIQEQYFDLQEKVNTLKQEKEILFQNFSKRYASQEEALNTYEDALKEEFERMKKAYEKRIDTIMWDNDRLKKEKARSLIDMKHKMDKEIETKNLLLKKLSCYIK
ncbi:hypothetical protein TTHERM_00530200 (macronuclear) [Tetrahymena thermophila SB210]|uniref:Uncharacterized protein n=1 Tax=Tetrahymena thermophila (strain SB210) TaxID=312017 RepID=I7MGD9_TETTS|nr:hypothetical protein TTHERM_00530200 [Tetrahymena thermophila SB210]EAR85068.1 hypothetical protein TTHERM_00530200 [Tetrahymena thermophila SB210]|eukprot:XP_001032731.1 hypothetical protein TTHERM_00530200 [Tetrahymena thermophila SB210]